MSADQPLVVDPDAVRLVPLGDLHHVAGAQRAHPGGHTQPGAHPAALLGEELDRLGVAHPLVVARQVGGRLPHPVERSFDVNGDGDPRHGSMLRGGLGRVCGRSRFATHGQEVQPHGRNPVDGHDLG